MFAIASEMPTPSLCVAGVPDHRLSAPTRGGTVPQAGRDDHGLPPSSFFIHLVFFLFFINSCRVWQQLVECGPQ